MQLTDSQQSALHKARLIANDIAAWANLNGEPGIYSEAVNVSRGIQYLVKEVEAAELELCEAPF